MPRYILGLLLILTGCASHAVRCDAHLQAINKPGNLPPHDAHESIR